MLSFFLIQLITLSLRFGMLTNANNRLQRQTKA
uniref:Uncharacterized protein n=2 Tax=Anguilla anguilla TaxID=7936 RepID=A0A0E9VPA4_ANGAN